MTNRKIEVSLMSTIVLLASLSIAVSAHSVGALIVSSSPGQSEFTVIVSRDGFNGTAGAFTVSVQQGDRVKITFVYGDNDLPKNNPHSMTVDGYGINTGLIDKTTLTTTVEFVAAKSGTFTFYCNIPCDGMQNLLAGKLVVRGVAGGETTVTTTSPLPSNTADAGIGTTPISGTLGIFGTLGLTSLNTSIEMVLIGGFDMLILGFVAGMIVTSKFASPKEES